MAEKRIREHLVKLQDLLKKEKQEDLRQYALRMQGTSLIERREKGVCWYPVRMEKSRYDAGERLLVRVSRPREHHQGHLFQSGKLASLFSAEGNADESQSVTAVVNQVGDHDMILTLNCDELPEWIQGPKLGVQLLFDENSYKEMSNCLKFLKETEEPDITRLLEVILGKREASFQEYDNVSHPELNQSQTLAMNKALSADDVAIIHGPPGTGKTTTLVQTILECLKNENQVLVCAPSNAAVDLLVERLRAHGLDVVRVGHPARVTEEILGTTLDARLAKHERYKDLRGMKRQAEEYRSMGLKYKRNFGKSEREQRKLLLSEAKKLKKEAQYFEEYLVGDILSKTRVVASTLIGSNNMAIRGMRFKTVFIDEASQGLEPACWLPILKASRVVFAGDHCQLPPTIKSFEAAKEGLSVTLFERAIEKQIGSTMLDEQYRMNSLIMDFSSQMFYRNMLKANDRVANWKLFDDDLAVEFIDTAGCGFDERIEPESRSTFNHEEAELLIKHLQNYLGELQERQCLDEVENIGVISPYKAQVIHLQEELPPAIELPEHLQGKMAVNTIDSFQGQERDIIYISLVRSNDKGEIGFLSDTRRMNVAMTRARKKLVMIGDSGTIGRHEFYDRFLDYVHQIGAYRSAYELLY